MKPPRKLVLALSVFGITIASTTNCFAQAKTVTLANSLAAQQNYAVTTNQIVQIISLAGYPALPIVNLWHSSGTVATTTNLGTYNGLTNISFSRASYTTSTGGTSYNPVLVTLTITTPSDSTMIPANSIVIPTDATGPVQIILESSADLVNWNAALPGTYGTSATNRFFRVRAVANP